MRRPIHLVPFALFAAFALCQEHPLFRSDTRLVEIYATVVDAKGRYLSGLTEERFKILDNGEPQKIVNFETDTSELACAIMLDTTGSMQLALPSVKNAAVKMIDQLRPGDSIAIYSFAQSVNLLQDFTTDKTAAKRAVMRTRAEGQTALFDSVSQVAREIARQKGRKGLIVFTDGADNASVLNINSAVARARKTGIPVYTIAQGDALIDKHLLESLESIAGGTAGRSYEVRKLSEIAPAFEDILSDLQHTYLLTFKPPQSDFGGWHTLQVALTGVKDYKVRAKEGYLAE